MKEECLKKITSLLKENKIIEAFNIMDNAIQQHPKLKDKYTQVLTNHAFYNRTRTDFSLGIITRETYHRESSTIIFRAFNLARSICEFIQPNPPTLSQTSYSEASIHNEDEKSKDIAESESHDSEEPIIISDVLRRQVEIEPQPEPLDSFTIALNKLLDEVKKYSDDRQSKNSKP